MKLKYIIIIIIMYFVNLFLLITQFFNFQPYLKGTVSETVKQLDVNKYLGHWYQVYGAPTNVIFQGYGTCITAQYNALENGYISVVNSQLNSHNELDQISGYAYYTNTSEPGQLTVHLYGVPVDSPYWVVKLGEIIDGQYQYSIVTTPSGISLWVLTRDINTFLNKYDSEVKEYLLENHFNYQEIIQEDCEYLKFAFIQ